MTRDIPFTGPTMRPADYAALRESIAAGMPGVVQPVRQQWHRANHWRALQLLGLPLVPEKIETGWLESFERHTRCRIPAAVFDLFRRPDALAALEMTPPDEWEMVESGPGPRLVRFDRGRSVDAGYGFAVGNRAGNDPAVFERTGADRAAWTPFADRFSTFVLMLAPYRATAALSARRPVGLRLRDRARDLSQYCALAAILEPVHAPGEPFWFWLGDDMECRGIVIPDEILVTLSARDTDALRALVLHIWRPYELRRLAADNPQLMPFLDGESAPWTGVRRMFTAIG